MKNDNSKLLNSFLKTLEYLTLLVIGGTIYVGLENLWRGYSHISMFFVGGFCFILIGLINEVYPWDMPFWKQVLIGDVMVLMVEFTSGVILNIILKLNVWDYSDLPFNILGQICLPFAILWLPIVAIGIVLDDYIRYLFFNEPKPKYKWI